MQGLHSTNHPGLSAISCSSTSFAAQSSRSDRESWRLLDRLSALPRDMVSVLACDVNVMSHTSHATNAMYAMYAINTRKSDVV